jgi:hypothetical protein
LPFLKINSQKFATLAIKGDSAKAARASPPNASGLESAQTSVWVSVRTLPAVDPVFSFGIRHRLPPFIARGNKWLFPGSPEGKASLSPRRNEFGDRLAMARDHHRLAFLHEFEKT